MCVLYISSRRRPTETPRPKDAALQSYYFPSRLSSKKCTNFRENYNIVFYFRSCTIYSNNIYARIPKIKVDPPSIPFIFRKSAAVLLFKPALLFCPLLHLSRVHQDKHGDQDRDGNSRRHSARSMALQASGTQNNGHLDRACLSTTHTPSKCCLSTRITPKQMGTGQKCPMRDKTCPSLDICAPKPRRRRGPRLYPVPISFNTFLFRVY